VEVRTAAAASVAKVTKALLLGVALRDGGGDDNDDDTALVLDALLPAVRAIASDPSEHVRASVASSVAALAPWAETTPSSQLLPVMLQLLRDTNSEVRLNVVRSLGDLHSVIGVDLLAQSLLRAVTGAGHGRAVESEARHPPTNALPRSPDRGGLLFAALGGSVLCVAARRRLQREVCRHRQPPPRVL